MGAADGNTTLFELIFSSTQHGRFPAPVLFKHYISGSMPYALTPPIPRF